MPSSFVNVAMTVSSPIAQLLASLACVARISQSAGGVPGPVTTSNALAAYVVSLSQ